MRVFQLVLIASLFGLAGCVNPHIKPKLSELELTHGGIAYFSTASLEKCIAHGIYLSLKNEKDDKAVNFPKYQFFVTNQFVEKDFPETRGLFQIVSLPAGTYKLLFDQGHPIPNVEYEQLLTPFKIEQGEVKYLGEIEVDGCFRIAVKIGDKYERDTEKLKALYPDVGKRKISKGLLKISK